MRIEVTGHHLEVTPALRARVRRRLAQLNSHRQPPLAHVSVVLSVSQNRHSCDLLARLGSKEFKARGEGSDMYAVIDQAAAKMERQLESAKGRKLARRAG